MKTTRYQKGDEECYRRYAQDLWYSYVMQRDKGCCIVGASLTGFTSHCGGTIEIHHLCGKHTRALRVDPDLACCLCSVHHRLDTSLSPHAAPQAFMDWLADEHPEIRERIREANSKNGYTNRTWAEWTVDLAERHKEAGFTLPSQPKKSRHISVFPFAVQPQF